MIKNALNFIEFIVHKGQKLTLAEFEALGEKADLSIIWLHGLGASSDDFVPVVPELRLSQTIHYIFPHAPNQAVTINAGAIMPSWYDILETIEERKIDEKQFDISVIQIQDLITRQIKQGFDSKNILLIGFSQGGAVAINSALTYPKQLLGVLALSTYIAKEPQIHSNNKKCPIFWFHGHYDNVVPISLSKKANEFFARNENNQNNFVLKTYPMAHEVCLQEIADIAKIINIINQTGPIH